MTRTKLPRSSGSRETVAVKRWSAGRAESPASPFAVELNETAAKFVAGHEPRLRSASSTHGLPHFRPNDFPLFIRGA